MPMYTLFTRAPISWAVIVLLLIANTGCDAPNPGPSSDNNDRTPDGDSLPWKIDPTTGRYELPEALFGQLTVRESNKFVAPHVILSDLNCAIAELDKVVHHGDPHRHQPLTHNTIKFTRESYEALRDQADPSPCGSTRGLAIIYGYNMESRQVECAFSFVCMELEDDIGPYEILEEPVYTLNNHSLGDFGMTLSSWYQGLGKAFQDSIVVDKYDNRSFQHIYKDKRPHMVYKLSQIDSLIADNHLAPDHWVEVVLVAEPRVWSQQDRGAEFSMKTCLVAVDATGRNVRDTPHVPGSGNYYERGADLGSACPPMCTNIAVFEGKGVDVRKSCKP